jgi:phosphoribosylformylglycinamidine (FGAM) synthase-like enzyme
VDDAPRYERPYVEPVPAGAVTLPSPAARVWGDDLRALLASTSFADTRPVWQQYDQSVGAGTVVGPGADAALLLIPGTAIGVAATTDCNALACGLDPYNGAAHAVAEAVRNLACVGAEPVGVTDCLNFGSPEKPEVMGQFVAALEGMAAACRAFEVPVVSGNVSFYNETSGNTILPTPTIGMVGVVPEVRHRPRRRWREGEAIYLLGPVEGELGGSRYLQVVLGLEAGPVPAVDYEGERRAAAVVRDLVRRGAVAATDLSDGGLAAAAVEMSDGEAGAALVLPDGVDPARALFGEWRGAFLLAVAADEPTLAAACRGLQFTRLGFAAGERLKVAMGTRVLLDEPVGALRDLRKECLGWLCGA